eukprot:g1623.t1
MMAPNLTPPPGSVGSPTKFFNPTLGIYEGAPPLFQELLPIRVARDKYNREEKIRREKRLKNLANTSRSEDFELGVSHESIDVNESFSAQKPTEAMKVGRNTYPGRKRKIQTKKDLKDQLESEVKHRMRIQRDFEELRKMRSSDFAVKKLEELKKQVTFEKKQKSSLQRKVDDLRIIIHELCKNTKFIKQPHESLAVRAIWGMTHSVRALPQKSSTSSTASNSDTVFKVTIFCPETGIQDKYNIKIGFLLDMIRAVDEDLYETYLLLAGNEDRANVFLCEVLCSGIVGEQSEVTLDIEELKKKKKSIIENCLTETDKITEQPLILPSRFALRIPRDESEVYFFFCHANGMDEKDCHVHVTRPANGPISTYKFTVDVPMCGKLSDFKALVKQKIENEFLK